MKNRLSPWNLGATLYMPATREDIADAVLHGKIPGLRSLVICLEDAVSEADIPIALKNLEHLLHELSNSMRSRGKNDWPLVFIRPRHAEMGRWSPRPILGSSRQVRNCEGANFFSNYHCLA